MSAVARRIPALALLAVLALVVSLVPPSLARAEVAPERARVEAALAADLAALPGVTPYAAFVHFRGGTPEYRAALLADHGLDSVRDFASIDVVYAVGTVADIASLRDEPGISYLQANRRLAYHGETATWATKVRVAQEQAAGGPYRDTAGRVLDGTGVGVAVVDSGIDGLHPDFAGRIGKNYKVACSTPLLASTNTGLCFGPVLVQDLPTGEATGGHGTHVAGIVGGSGAASQGTFRGVAPGVTLFGYSVGETISVLFAAEAFNHMLTNYDTFSPRLRVINNSYGETAGTAFDPENVQTKLADKLIAKGVVITWSAGNNAGTGAADATGSQSKNPTPGNISVANYDDLGTGSRTSGVVSGSSRGRSGQPATYPDLAAPGALITSTCKATLPVCYANAGVTPAWAPNYFVLGGTSMAAPHVAGAAALLLQAKPGLTPAQIEDVLQDTARKTTVGAGYEADPQNPGGTTSVDRGAGLLDLQAALDALGVAHDGAVVADLPTISVQSPTEGQVFDGTSAVSVSGIATDGVAAPAPFATASLAGGDAGDAPGPGALDLVALRAIEQTAGMRYTLSVRDVADPGPLASIEFRQNVDGVPAVTTLNVLPASVTVPARGARNTALASDVVRDADADTIAFTLTWAELGNPGSVTIGHNVNVRSFGALVHDVLPGGVGLTVNTNPVFGAPYTLRRPDLTQPPVATATLAVDGGAETPAPVSGGSPSYAVGGVIDVPTLVDGPHTLVARLYLDGALAASDTVAFVVERVRVVSSSVAITSPTDGATVPRQFVDVTGTAGSDAPAAQARRVTTQLTGGAYDSGEQEALGSNSWVQSVDFGALDAGPYVLTARLYLDGVIAATASRTLVVPVPPVLVSCSPQALSFWQNQYDGGQKAVLSAAESAALATRAAELSSGYFADARSLTNTLFVKGKLAAELTTARQYAALLLNLAGGELSATYTRQVGLSGAEGLSSSTYNTTRVGSTVRAAAAWVRAQLPGGDLSAANTVASSINRGDGLVC